MVTVRSMSDERDGPVLSRSPTQSGRGAIPRYQWLGHGRLAEYEARYDGEIAEVDRHLGRLLEALRECEVESHLVVTRPGLMTLGYETDLSRDQLYDLADVVYAENEAHYCPGCQTGGRLLADRALSRLLHADWPRRVEELD